MVNLKAEGKASSSSSVTSAKIAKICLSISEGNLHKFVASIDVKAPPNYELLIEVSRSINKRVQTQKLTANELKVSVKLYEYLAKSLKYWPDRFHPYTMYLSNFYKHLVSNEKKYCREIDEYILEMIWANPDLFTHPVRNKDSDYAFTNYFALTWNYMKESNEVFEPQTNFELGMMALRWTLPKGINCFQLIGHKFSTCCQFALRNPPDTPREKIEPVLARFNTSLVNFFKKEALIYNHKRQKTKFELAQFDGLLQIISAQIRILIHYGSYEPIITAIGNIFKSLQLHYDRDLLKIVNEFFIRTAKLLYALRPIIEDKCIPNVKFKQFPDLLTLLEKLTPSENYDAQGVKYLLINSLMELFTWTIQFIRQNRKVKIPLFTEEEYGWLQNGVNKFSEIFVELTTSHTFPLEKKEADTNGIFLLTKYKLLSEFLKTQKPSKEWVAGVTEDCSATLDICEQLYKRSKTPVEFIRRTNNALTDLFVHLQKTESAEGFTKKVIKFLSRAIQTPEFKGASELISNIVPTVGDYYYQIGDLDGGLGWLTKWLVKVPELLQPPAQSFDYFEPSKWADISHQWTRMKREAQKLEKEDIEKKTILDFKDAKSLDSKLKPIYLRYELNSYFSCKPVLRNSLYAVGKTLQKNGLTYDKILGIIVEALSLFWGEDSENVVGAISLCESALEALYSMKKITAPRSILLFLANAWLGLARVRYNSIVANEQLKYLSEQEKLADKEDLLAKAQEDKEAIIDDTNGKYTLIIPGITSQTLRVEVETGECFTNAIEYLHSLTALKDEMLKEFVDRISSSFVTLTARLLASLLPTFGNEIANVKAWNACFVLSRIYDRKYLTFFSGMELMKMLPGLDSEITDKLDEIHTCIENRNSTNNKSYLLRYELAKSVVCLKEQKFEEGLSHLNEVLAMRLTMDNLDTTVTMIGEAFYVLSLYKKQSQIYPFELSSIDPDLRGISPCALAHRGFRNLMGMSRELSAPETGWSGMIHNFTLMSLIYTLGNFICQELCEMGRIKELQQMATSLLYTTQSTGHVSRSIQVLLQLASKDFEGKQMDSCQNKIQSIQGMIAEEIPSGGSPMELEKLLKKEMGKEEIKEMTELLSNEKPFSWKLTPITLPEYNYMSSGGREESKKDTSPLFDKITFGQFSPFSHHINCNCNVCLHSFLPYSIIKYYALQARFAMYGKDESLPNAILQRAKIYLDKSLVRVMVNVGSLKKQLEHVANPDCIDRFLKATFLTPFMDAAFNILLTEMDLSEDSKDVFTGFNQIHEGLTFSPQSDSTHPFIPLEILLSSLLRDIIGQDWAHIRKGGIRGTLEGAHAKYERMKLAQKGICPTSPAELTMEEKFAHLAITAPKKDLKRIGKKLPFPYSPAPPKHPEGTHFPTAEEEDLAKLHSKVATVLTFSSDSDN